MSSSFLSVLIQRQAGKYGDRVALRYRDYKTETWIPVSWNQFAATVKTVSNALIELGIGIQENIAVFLKINRNACMWTLELLEYGLLLYHFMLPVPRRRYIIW